MTYDKAFFLLLTAFLAREFWFSYTLHKILNKLASRNYFEYQQASQFKPHEQKPVRLDDYAGEDLGVLTGIG